MLKTTLKLFPLWFLSLGVALVSLRFFLMGVDGMFAGIPEFIDHINNRKLALVLHISASPVALILGLFQFLPRLRARRPALHRWTGRLYVATIVVGGISGLILALGMTGRPSATLGFSALAILWVAATLFAIRLAMTGQTARHRRWMLRSYALTFAAVTLRLEMPFFFIFAGMEYGEVSNYVAWLAWIPNLIFAEWWLRKGKAEPAPTPA